MLCHPWSLEHPVECRPGLVWDGRPWEELPGHRQLRRPECYPVPKQMSSPASKDTPLRDRAVVHRQHR